MKQKVEIYCEPNIHLGLYNKSKKELELTYKGEWKYLEFFCRKYNITNPELVTKSFLLELSLDIDNLWKEFLQSLIIITGKKDLWTLWWIKIKRQSSKIIEVSRIKDFLYGCYNEEYSSLSTWERNIEVVDAEGKVLSNTHYKKAMRLIDTKRAIQIDKYKIQLVHNIVTEIYYLPLLRELLFKRQNKCCNKCKKEYDRHILELHHRFIPQTFKIINKEWNTELICHPCHRERHSNKFSLVNILIWYVDIREKFFSNLFNKIWKN